MRELVIGGRVINDSEPCYVIAEIGNNHQGNVIQACELVQMAAECHADAVKFQCRTNETLYSSSLLERDYRNPNSFGATYGEHRHALELGRDDYTRIARMASGSGITWFATAFDETAADLLETLDVPAYKLASGALTDLPLLIHVALKQKPIILSTGGGTLSDIERAVDTILPLNRQLALLHCTASYPCDYAELNLRCIETLRHTFPELVIGWSGHDVGIAMSVAAYMLGARIVEKHVTFARAAKGTDHAFSLERPGLQRLCRDLARAHVALGDGFKRWYESERGPISKMRRTYGDEGYRIYG